MGARGSWWQRLTAAVAGDRVGERSAGRVSGRPPSANGASSFHLRWHTAEPLVEVSVTLEVLEPPTVEHLYFWALQADFAGRDGTRGGGAHLGLQWHPRHPGSTAVNWGGYGADGAELHGSESTLPSALHNRNTRDLAWSPSVPYRLTIAPAPAEDQPPHDVATAWRGSVTDLLTGSITVVRDLYSTGDHISSVIMWSEVFARCDDPTVAIRWSDPTATASDGRTIEPDRFLVNYQAHHDGGCANTDSSVDGRGLVQRTAVARTTPQGSALPAR